MLKIESLSVSYASLDVLQEISLEVNAGQVLALIGPNGAGKSTLVRAVSGVVPLKSGKVLFNGKDFLALPPIVRARFLAVVPQVVNLPPAFTVWETVLLGRTPFLNFLGQTSSQDDEIARNALIRVDALDLAKRRVGEISGGEQQRVLLARALAQTTPILVLDEPASNLDLRHQVDLMEIVRSLAGEGLTLLIAMHDLNLAARYADCMALMVKGKIKAAGTPRQVLTPEIIADAYHLPVRIVPHPFANVPLVLPER